ncbi:MAG: ParB/RepB/Spo0J family partition protein [Pseudomonadota bacterium]
MAKKQEPRRGLGRGLSALLGDDAAALTADTPRPGNPPAHMDLMVPIEMIAPNTDQPRRQFDDDDLEELAASIRAHGIIQPLVLRIDPSQKSLYQIVAGERRWRAAQRAQLHQVPAVIRELDDRGVLEIAIVENIQRTDLNPVEEAQGYAQLIDQFGHTQAELARITGKSRSHLANLLRLLTLPEPVLEALRKGELTAGHARALVTASDPAALCREVIARGLSVRETERLAKQAAPSAPRAPKPKAEKDADTRMLEGDLTAAIGMAVRIEHAGQDGGEMRIRYRDLEQLDKLCQKLAE